ncbi:glycosyltransferase [Stenotrophomonas sp.]|uniref:glycosyltransferase n=1 Tax=Stenotrophomonas sp. TaxID=69392 RepID=UPI0028ADF9AD|nr:glycosyltransferase [Stenotrophomonas sp.]
MHTLNRGMLPWFRITVLCPHAPGAKHVENLEGVDVVRYRYAPTSLERLVNSGGISSNLKHHPWMHLLLPGFMLSQLIHTAYLSYSLRPAALHAHWIIPQAWIAAVCSRLLRLKTPILVTSHGADLFTLKGKIATRLKRWSLRCTAGWTVVSAAMRPRLAELGPEASSIEVMPMGIDLTARFTPDESVARSPKELLFVGRIVEKKGLIYLIQALALVRQQHPDVRLTIAGFGPDQAACEEETRKLGLASLVTFVGAQDQSALPGLYRRSTALVAPFIEADNGDQEGLGLVMVEAIGCGCPIVTTRLPAILELQDGQWPPYVAEPADVHSLAEQVMRVLSAPSKASEWARELRPSLVARFDQQAVSRAYACKLAQLAGLDF